MVNGNNSPTGMAVMYEGSEEGISGGLIENVEVINARGCFGGYPISDLYETGTTCALSFCNADYENAIRDKNRDRFSMWTAGSNVREGVHSHNITVVDSYYY